MAGYADHPGSRISPHELLADRRDGPVRPARDELLDAMAMDRPVPVAVGDPLLASQNGPRPSSPRRAAGPGRATKRPSDRVPRRTYAPATMSVNEGARQRSRGDPGASAPPEGHS